MRSKTLVFQVLNYIMQSCLSSRPVITSVPVIIISNFLFFLSFQFAFWAWGEFIDIGQNGLLQMLRFTHNYETYTGKILVLLVRYDYSGQLMHYTRLNERVAMSEVKVAVILKVKTLGHTKLYDTWKLEESP